MLVVTSPGSAERSVSAVLAGRRRQKALIQALSIREDEARRRLDAVLAPSIEVLTVAMVKTLLGEVVPALDPCC